MHFQILTKSTAIILSSPPLPGYEYHRLFIHLCQLRRLVNCTEQRPPNTQARNSCLYAPNRLGSYTSTKTVTKQKHPLLPRPVQSIQNLSVTYYLTNKTSYCEKKLDVFNNITLSLYNLL